MPADNSALIARIAADLREGMADGGWPADAMLPSEQELSADYQTSRYTVRRALEALAAEGLVCKQAGRGWQVQPADAVRHDLVAVVVPADHETRVFAPLCAELERLGVRYEHLPELVVRGSGKRYGAGAARRILAASRAGAVILFDDATLPADFGRAIAKGGRALIQIGAGEPQGWDTCCCDNYQSSDRLVAMAVAAGHRHIGYIARAEICQRLASFRQRFRGWAAAVVGRGLPAEHHLLPADYATNPVAVEAMEAWLRRQREQMTCLIFDSFSLSMLVLSLSRCGYELGQGGLSLLALGGEVGSLFAGGPAPFHRIHGVREAWEPVAKAAAQRAVARLAGDRGVPQHILLPFDDHPGDSLFPMRS